MTTHLGLQRIMIPGSQVSALTTGNITLTGARGQTIIPVDYLVVAGGGGGGGRNVGGGGGAGGYRTSIGGTYLTAIANTSYTITVGAGGAGGSSSTTGNKGSNGGSSSVSGTGFTTVIV